MSGYALWANSTYRLDVRLGVNIKVRGVHCCAAQQPITAIKRSRHRSTPDPVGLWLKG